MLADGIRLMAVGMVTVFGFLTILVAVMAGQSAFFAFFEERFRDAAPLPGTTPAEGDDEVALAIAIAHAKRVGGSAPA